MKTNETLNLINKDFLEKVYSFAYRRCNTSLEAEDLCSKIILEVITALGKQQEVQNFYGLVWTIAKRVYADYCEERHRDSNCVSLENNIFEPVSENNEIDSFIDNAVAAEQLKKILYQMSFLSRSYRDVIVMYYLDEIKVKDIASKLNISENAVKQRLFSARNEIRKEVSVMKNNNLTLKPVHFSKFGSGNPCGNDPSEQYGRTFSQNLIYLCKNTAKSVKELSDELCVPMPYVEEEVEIQVQGTNGKYGALRKTENGKYISNILVADYDEYQKANEIFKAYAPKICMELKKSLAITEKKLLNFPFLSKQNEIKFIFWALVSRFVTYSFLNKVTGHIADKHYKGTKIPKREFTAAAVAFSEDFTDVGYAIDGIYTNYFLGYKSIVIANMHGKLLDAHFYSGHSISHDEKLMMLIRSIEGVDIDSLNESEKELAAKCIECGYIRKNGNILEPNIIVIDKKDQNEFFSIADKFTENLNPVIEKLADKLADFMKKHIPAHLQNEYKSYTELIAGEQFISEIIDLLISEHLLSKPKNRLCAEGMLMIVEK